MRFPTGLRLCSWILTALLAAAPAWSQEPLLAPSLFVKASEPPPGQGLMLEVSAQRALSMGFPAIASDLYQRLLNDPRTPITERNRFTVELATALLEEGRAAEAETALQKYTGLPSPTCRLRLGMVHARFRRYDAARAELAAVRLDDLPEQDRSWYYFLEGALADVARDYNRSGALYQQAIDAAKSEAQRARFTLAREHARLSLGQYSEAEAAALRQNVERLQGRALYNVVGLYAIALNGLGKASEASVLLQRQLQALPNEERATADEWRLLLGLIAGADSGVGRNALGQLLAVGADPVKQRIALQLLAQTSRSGANRDDFRRRLDDLLGAPITHPLTEELLFFRAQIALSDKDYPRAESSANQLLERFPGSQLKGTAYGVLTGLAWEQGRYRNAASQATKARDLLPPGNARAQLGVLVAESYFRAGLKDDDKNALRNAADAYAAALESVPEGVSTGSLMFQRVVSEIEADRLAEAQVILDQYSKDQRLDAINRWQAEWNLARALQVAQRVPDAYARVNRLMQEPAAGLPADLRARLGWLQAQLALTAGEPARALSLSEPLLDSLDKVEEPLRSQITGTTLLLQAQACYAVTPPRPDDGNDRLRRLRSDHPRSDAAVYSYFVQADESARKGQLVEAQALLQKLADELPQSAYAPYALYQAAQYARRRAQENYYSEAYKILESLVQKYPKNELFFYARLEQGNLMRLLNDYGAAQRFYESLVNEFSQHRDVFSAQIALADCHAAMAAADPSHLESAVTIYERLLDLQTAPIDVRVEAGYKCGNGLNQRGNLDGARDVWGRVMTAFVPDEARGVALQSKGRYWMARTLLSLGELFEKQSKLEQAGEAYDLLIKKGLPGEALAGERLARLRPAVAIPAAR